MIIRDSVYFPPAFMNVRIYSRTTVYTDLSLIFHSYQNVIGVAAVYSTALWDVHAYETSGRNSYRTGQRTTLLLTHSFRRQEFIYLILYLNP